MISVAYSPLGGNCSSTPCADETWRTLQNLDQRYLRFGLGFDGPQAERNGQLCPRCETGPTMLPEKLLPKYIILVRWNTFRLDLVGRTQIVTAITIVAAVFALRLFVL
jgi:hypothetical protein